jgi:hypothetical protein
VCLSFIAAVVRFVDGVAGKGGVSRLYPTSISPNPHVIAAYVMAIWIGQVGYCLMLVLATKPETKVFYTNNGSTVLMGLYRKQW